MIILKQQSSKNQRKLEDYLSEYLENLDENNIRICGKTLAEIEQEHKKMENKTNDKKQ